MIEKVNEILLFWFGSDKQNYLANAAKWWRGSPELDQEISDRFAKVHHLAATGELDIWLNQPLSCLAYIILLDQFSRHIYRNTPLAFAQDARARSACLRGREHKLDKELHIVQRQFFYMPLEHSEDIDDQKLCLALMKQLVEEAKDQQPPQYLQAMEQAFDYAEQHYDIIRNFNRFPHRNAVLERENTQEEMVFLTLPNSSF